MTFEIRAFLWRLVSRCGLCVGLLLAELSVGGVAQGAPTAVPVAPSQAIVGPTSDEANSALADAVVAESLEDALADGKLVVLCTAADESWCDDYTLDTDPVWTIRAGAVILDRSQPDDEVIARPLGGPLAVTAGGDFNFGWRGGVDVYIARQTPNGIGVEARYFNVDSSAGYDYGNPGDLEIGHTSITNLIDFDGGYQSKLNSSEINLRVPASQRFTWLAGFRWLELHENLNYDVDLLGLVNNDFRWNTDNHLYGGQMGADLQLWDLDSPLSISSVLKAGVYGNNADNFFAYRVNSIPLVTGGAAQGDVAFVGDIGVNVSYQVTRHFALTGGYQMLWINGAALASDQAALTLRKVDVDVLTTAGDLFYHGALTGGVITW